jgi:hypothetical protein
VLDVEGIRTTGVAIWKTPLRIRVGRTGMPPPDNTEKKPSSADSPSEGRPLAYEQQCRNPPGARGRFGKHGCSQTDDPARSRNESDHCAQILACVRKIRMTEMGAMSHTPAIQRSCLGALPHLMFFFHLMGPRVPWRSRSNRSAGVTANRMDETFF